MAVIKFIGQLLKCNVLLHYCLHELGKGFVNAVAFLVRFLWHT
jgi:hypothetical protein